MCAGDCSRFIGLCLYPFCGLSIVCNILLLFSNWSLDAVNNAGERMSPEVLYFGGLLGSGLLVLIPAICIQHAGLKGCCNNRCGLFISVLLAAVALCGSLYGFVTSLLGIINGPVCNYWFINGDQRWTAPFKQDKEFLDLEMSYLFNKASWYRCIEPEGVVEFNIILFSTILAASAIEMILCAVQVINGLCGVLCGTCQKR